MQKTKRIYSKLEKIEKDMDIIKSMLSWQAGEAKRIVSIRGLLRGMKVDEQDIIEAKKSLFRLNIKSGKLYKYGSYL